MSAQDQQAYKNLKIVHVVTLQLASREVSREKIQSVTDDMEEYADGETPICRDHLIGSLSCTRVGARAIREILVILREKELI